MTLTISQFDNNVLTEKGLVLRTALPFVKPQKQTCGEKFWKNVPWQDKEDSE